MIDPSVWPTIWFLAVEGVRCYGPPVEKKSQGESKERIFVVFIDEGVLLKTDCIVRIGDAVMILWPPILDS